MLDYVLQIALVQMFALQIKVSPTCSPLQPAGSLAQAKFWQRSYISCVENREETALVFRDFAGTTHTRAETIPPASQAAYKFSLYFIILFYLSAVKEYSFLPIHFFKKFIYCFPKLCLQCTLSFHERQKNFFCLGVNNPTNSNRSILRKRSDYNNGKYGD